MKRQVVIGLLGTVLDSRFGPKRWDRWRPSVAIAQFPDLSVHRAIAVAQIIKKNGFAPQHIGVMGFGEDRPIADGSTPAGDSQNRRVEIYILPKGTVAQVASASPKPVGG